MHGVKSNFEDYFKFPVAHPMAGSIIDPHSLGYVYVIGFEEPGIVKIGSAANPGMRLTELQCGNPFELKLLATVSIYSGNPCLVEFAAHRLASQYRIRGEWFDLSAERAVKIILRAARNAKVSHAAYAAVLAQAEIERTAERVLDDSGGDSERRRKLRIKLGMD